MKDAIARKKVAYKELCKCGSEENKARYKSTKKKAKKAVARAMRMETDHRLDELGEKTNNVFKLLKNMKKDGKDLGGRCMRGKDGG